MRVSVAAEDLPGQSAVVASIPSASDPDVRYLVTRQLDGSLACQCRGFGYQSRADGLCRHIDEAQEQGRYHRTLAFLLA